MKRLNVLIAGLVFFYFSTNCKILAQSIKPIATINGLFDGKININDLLNCKKIKIRNNTNYKIISYTLWNVLARNEKMINGTNRFNSEVYNIVKKKPVFLVFYRIKAVNKNKDTITLNPITLQIAEGKSEKNRIPEITKYIEIAGKSEGKVEKNWIAAQTGIKTKDNKYTIIGYELHHCWRCCYCANGISNSSKFSSSQQSRIRQTRRHQNIVIYRIKAKKKNEDTYIMPPMIFTIN